MTLLSFKDLNLPFASLSAVTQTLEMAALLGVTVLILALTYFTTRWIGRKARLSQDTRNIKIKERLALGRDKYLAIVEAAGKSYLIGVTAQSIQMLTELDQEQLNYKSSSEQPSFGKLYKTIREKGIKGLTGKDDDQHGDQTGSDNNHTGNGDRE